MFVASGIKRNRKADIARLQKDGAVLTYRGRLVLSYDTKTEFSMFVKRFRYLTTNKAWISEGLSDLDDHFGLQENHFNGLIHLDETSEKDRQSFKQILVATSLQHEYSKDTFTREWNHIFIRVDELVSDQQLQQLLDFLEKENSSLVPTIQVNVLTDRFSSSTIQLLVKLNDLAENKGWKKPIVNINNLNKTNEFEDNSWDMDNECANGWDIETLARANMEVDRVVEKIKKAKLSPLETVQFLNDYVSRLVEYKHSRNVVYRRASSYLGAFLNKPELICAGFSDMIVRIVEKLNMPGLSCRYFATKHYTIDEKKYKSKDSSDWFGKDMPYIDGHHAQIMFMIDDEKYAYHGDNFMDATWDNRKGDEWPLYAFALLPMNALQGYKNVVVREATGDESIRKGMSTATAMEYEERVDGKIPNIDLDIVTNARHAELTQEMCEKSIFEMYKRMHPKEAKLEELKDVIWHIVGEAYDKQKETFIEDVTVYGSKLPVISDEWMEECFHRLEAEYQVEQHKEVQDQQYSLLKEKQLIEKLLGILKKPKEQAEPQDLIDQLDLADRLYVKAYKKEDMIKELEERLKKIKPKLTDGIDEVGDGMDDR